MSKFIVTHSELSSENELTDVSRVCSPNTTPVIIPFIQTPSFHSSGLHHESTTCQWYKHVPYALLPEFPSFILISNFQDLGYHFPMFYLCVSLWHLWIVCSHSWFLWTAMRIFLIYHCFSFLFPLPEIEGSLVDHDMF